MPLYTQHMPPPTATQSWQTLTASQAGKHSLNKSGCRCNATQLSTQRGQLLEACVPSAAAEASLRLQCTRTCRHLNIMLKFSPLTCSCTQHDMQVCSATHILGKQLCWQVSACPAHAPRLCTETFTVTTRSQRCVSRPTRSLGRQEQKEIPLPWHGP